jgi:3-phenylpropionate/trans-cinnamate dioxygenase ferredoxin reductase component
MNTPTLMIVGASLAGATVTALDTGNSRVALDDGRELHYDRLLLATGAQPRRLSSPGATLAGVPFARAG